MVIVLYSPSSYLIDSSYFIDSFNFLCIVIMNCSCKNNSFDELVSLPILLDRVIIIVPY